MATTINDMRQYRGAVTRALARVRAEYPEVKQWGNVSARTVSKQAARLNWGYLDYVGEREPITVSIAPEGDGVEYRLPCGAHGWVLVGPSQWDDVPTIAEGVEHAVLLAYRKASYLY